MTPFSHSEGRRAFTEFYEWMIPSPRYGVYKPDYFSLIFDIVLSPDPMLEPPYDPVKDGVEFEIGFDIWVCACMLDAVVNHTDYTQDCIDYAAQYKQLCEVIQHMLQKSHSGNVSLFTTRTKYATKPRLLCNILPVQIAHRN